MDRSRFSPHASPNHSTSTSKDRGGALWQGATRAVILLLFVACTDDRITPLPTGITEARSETQFTMGLGRSMRARLDDEWSLLARQDIPGFAGYYIESDGRVVVMARTSGVQSTAEAYVRAKMLALGVTPAEYAFRLVKYDAEQLRRWHDSLIPMLGDGVIMTDLDEARNQVFVGIASDASTSTLRSELLQRGIPDDAFVIQYVQQPSRDVSLHSVFRPTVAGVSLSGCTLGFNTIYNNKAAFLTSSHCSDEPFSALPDSTIWRQPIFGSKVGFEALDRELMTGYLLFQAAGRSWVCGGIGCRFSDAMIGVYYDSIPKTQGAIARTMFFSSTATSGSFTIDPNDSVFQIINKLPFSFMSVGLPTSKVGVGTGWTRGAITRTCINVPYIGENLLCQHQASYYRQPGDSGSPVFFDSYGDPPPNHGVHLLGIHVGSAPDNENHGVFSTIQGIEDDFVLTLKVCNWANPC